MKKLIALWTVLALLAGCGCSRAPEAQKDPNETDGNGTTEQQDGSLQNGSGTTQTPGSVGDAVQDGMDDVGEAVGEAGSAVEDGAKDIGDAITEEENQTDNGTAGDSADTNTGAAAQNP
ncbi:hypothetical protein [Agathobaculum desmolans]|uniref:hypothetical protein n=1 Tax=Agathobaculum desmolans TaxID=39484 RepID=UPI00248F3946|nr:hypothetical protein [Agathobaculum desmolans]